MLKFAVCFLSLLALSLSFTVSQWGVTQEKCCISCSLPAVKYYVIKNNKCGESCIDPKDYNKIKVFEQGLVLASSNTPCADNTYNKYDTTVTHGFGSLKSTLDMYVWGGN
jgi:hypothetical protein